MKYLVLATDYDGTLAHDGRVDADTLAALERLQGSGRQLVLVTGRTLDSLMSVFPRFDIFDRIVAENGGVLYRPKTRETVVLCEPPPERFVSLLRRRGVDPLEVGQALIACEKPCENTVLGAIRDLGLELHVIFNKAAVMVLPTGTNKATGLGRALAEMCISPHNCIGIGDAENDHAFLAMSECAVAVHDALTSVKQRADHVTRGGAGVGVVELVDRLLATDLAELEPRMARHALLLGKDENGAETCVAAHGSNVLLAGRSGSGKSTLATAFTERLLERELQFCVIDPEGDHRLPPECAVRLGDEKQPPSIERALELLSVPSRNAVLNLLGVKLEERPAFFASLFLRLQELRLRTGRPHWILIDEAHHLLPSDAGVGGIGFSNIVNTFLVTVHPSHVARSVLQAMDVILAVGSFDPLDEFARTLGMKTPKRPVSAANGKGTFAWDRRNDHAPFLFRAAIPHTERRRHLRKYAEGELDPERSFYFRGPEGKLALRAQNLALFLQLADGVDDETWSFHLETGDYSRWARDAIKDGDLADDIATVEQNTPALSPGESRAQIRAAIERRYTRAS